MFTVDRAVTIQGPGFATKLRAPFAALQQILGPPFDDDTPDKCSTIWSLSDGRHMVMIYDWRDDHDPSFRVDTFRALAQYDWRISANSEQAATAFCRWLSAAVIAKLGEVWTLGRGGRAELNRLMDGGMSLTDALQKMPMQTAGDLEARFGWPIRG